MPGFNAEIYRIAANEHIAVARDLYSLHRYGLCFYVAGLSVECILRAYIVRRNPQVDARHDIAALFYDSKLSNTVHSEQAIKLNANIGLIHALWQNQHRYRSDESLRSFLKKGHHDRGIRGDSLKENTRRLVDAAADIIRIGMRKWNI